MTLPFTAMGATGVMETRQMLVEPVPGLTAGALVMKTKLLSERPVPQDWTLAWTLALVLVAVIALLLTLRYLSRNFQLARRQ